MAQEIQSSWINSNTQELRGSLYRAVCSGVGPSLDIARKEASESCRVSASQQLTTNIQVKSISIETEKEVAYHRESIETLRYSGLICKPGREKIEESSGQVKVWLECSFDLSKARVLPSAKIDQTQENDKTQKNGWIKNKEKLERSAAGYTIEAKPGRHISSNRKILVLAVIPQCTDLLIRGSAPGRIVKCEDDPMTIRLEQTDSQIIVRAKGYISKTIELSKRKESEESVQVFLDPKD